MKVVGSHGFKIFPSKSCYYKFVLLLGVSGNSYKLQTGFYSIMLSKLSTSKYHKPFRWTTLVSALST